MVFLSINLLKLEAPNSWIPQLSVLSPDNLYENRLRYVEWIRFLLFLFRQDYQDYQIFFRLRRGAFWPKAVLSRWSCWSCLIIFFKIGIHSSFYLLRLDANDQTLALRTKILYAAKLASKRQTLSPEHQQSTSLVLKFFPVYSESKPLINPSS